MTRRAAANARREAAKQPNGPSCQCPYFLPDDEWAFLRCGCRVAHYINDNAHEDAIGASHYIAPTDWTCRLVKRDTVEVPLHEVQDCWRWRLASGAMDSQEDSEDVRLDYGELTLA